MKLLIAGSQKELNIEHRTLNFQHRIMNSACRELFVERSILKQVRKDNSPYEFIHISIQRFVDLKNGRAQRHYYWITPRRD